MLSTPPFASPKMLRSALGLACATLVASASTACWAQGPESREGTQSPQAQAPAAASPSGAAVSAPASPVGQASSSSSGTPSRAANAILPASPRTSLSGRAFSLYDPTDAGLSPQADKPLVEADPAAASEPRDANGSSAGPSSPRGVDLPPTSSALIADALNDRPASEEAQFACRVAIAALQSLDQPAADCFATATALHIRGPSPQGSPQERMAAEARYQFLSIVAGGFAMAHFDAPPVKWIVVGHHNASMCLATSAESAKEDIDIVTRLADQARKAQSEDFSSPGLDELESQMVRNLRRAPCLAGPGSH